MNPTTPIVWIDSDDELHVDFPALYRYSERVHGDTYNATNGPLAATMGLVQMLVAAAEARLGSGTARHIVGYLNERFPQGEAKGN